MRKLQFREVMSLTQGHTASESWSQDLNSVFLESIRIRTLLTTFFFVLAAPHGI